MTPKTAIALIVFCLTMPGVLFGPARAGEQPSQNFTFERLAASRDVDDSFDRGSIKLMVNVYRPVSNDRHRVVLFSHGSTGGFATDPSTINPPAPSIVQFFTTRGYTVVAPMRRGIGVSGGTYREECNVTAGKCTAADNLALGKSGVDEAIRDIDAVLDQLVLGKLAPADSKILLVGVSRGGFLSILLAARHPQLASGILSFAGGWFRVGDDQPAAERIDRMTFQTEQLAHAAPTVRVPAMWIYAQRDSLYSQAFTRLFHKSFVDAGGHADYVFIDQHALPDGHLVASQAALWEAHADRFLLSIE
jgi:pimeloyl-ACP methyl ester carboxylesterase